MDFTNELKLDGLQAQLEEESKMRKEGSFEKERSGRASRVNADDILIKKDKYRRSRSESTGRSQEERIRNRSRTRDDGGESSHKVWSRRSEEHTSELQSQFRISYAVFCLKKKTKTNKKKNTSN